MDDNEIKTKLDTLSEYQAHRDLIEAEKRKLLDDVKVPAEVEAVVKAGTARIAEVDGARPDDGFDAAIQAELAAVVIPEEIKAALAEIDAKRAAIMAKKREHDEGVRLEIAARKQAIQAEIDAKVKDVYAAIEQRRRDIEAEFAGKSEAVDDNIRKLTEEIKNDIRTVGHSVKGSNYQGVYVSGRVTWDNKGLDGYAVGHPEILYMRKEGDPSVSIRRI
jgi:hypothetical protein